MQRHAARRLSLTWVFKNPKSAPWTATGAIGPSASPSPHRADGVPAALNDHLAA